MAITVNPLNLQEACVLLLNVASHSAGDTLFEYDHEAATQVIKTIGYMPKDIVLCGWYIYTNPFIQPSTMANYLTNDSTSGETLQKIKEVREEIRQPYSILTSMFTRSASRISPVSGSRVMHLQVRLAAPSSHNTRKTQILL